MNTLKFLKSKRVLSCLTVSSLLCMMTVAGLPASRLTSKAWEWTDTAPWSKKTVSTSIEFEPYDGNFAVFPNYGGARYFDSPWRKIYIPEKYDTDTYIAPVNVRFSYAYNGEVTTRSYSDPEEIYTPKVAIDIASGENDKLLFSGTYSDSPVLNIPVPNPDTDWYWVRFRFSIPSSAPVEGYTMKTFNFTITYDIYYRDSSGGALPDGWSENTTAPAATLPNDLPTVTTATPPEDTAEQISGLLEFPSGLLDGMHYLRDTISQFLGLRYVSFIVVLGLICALVAWFLH